MRVCIIDETKVLKTYIYCFFQLTHIVYGKQHKGKAMKAEIKGSFVCVNPSCVLVKNKKVVKSRYTALALSIELSRLAWLILEDIFPEFNSEISHSKN